MLKVERERSSYVKIGRLIDCWTLTCLLDHSCELEYFRSILLSLNDHELQTVESFFERLSLIIVERLNLLNFGRLPNKLRLKYEEWRRRNSFACKFWDVFSLSDTRSCFDDDKTLQLFLQLTKTRVNSWFEPISREGSVFLYDRVWRLKSIVSVLRLGLRPFWGAKNNTTNTCEGA